MRRSLIRIAALALVCAALGAAGPEPVAVHGSWAVVVRRPAPQSELLVRVSHPLAIRARPGAGSVVGRMPARSPSYRLPIRAWILRRSRSGRYGHVAVPYVAHHRLGWIDLRGLRLSRTRIRVDADLSRHVLVVRRGGRVLFRAPAATGAPSSPTPTGRYWVTDRVPFPRSSSYGSFAFGLSGIQPRLPSGWTGGDQLAIHGTNRPSSIGRSVSAGCLRVSERVLRGLRPLLALGTPVVISR